MNQKTITRLLFFLLIGIGICLTPVFSQKTQPTSSDDSIRAVVRNRIDQHESLRAAPISVSVADGVVTLAGTVRNLAERKRASREVEEVDGVTRVVNQLSVSAVNQTDQQLADEAARSIRSFVYYDIFDWVGGNVRDGVLTLNGFVREPWRKKEYESRMERVDGIREIRDELVVLPVSIYDDQIRQAAVRAIYGNPLFQRYARRALPPIHIIVEHGTVLLKGVVLTNVEKIQAGNLVRSQVLSLKVTNGLAVES